MPCCLLKVHAVPIVMHPVHGVVLEQRTLRTLHASQARFVRALEETSTDILRTCVACYKHIEKEGNVQKFGPSVE